MLPFIDLKRQYEDLKDRIDRRVLGVMAHGGFIQGPEVGEFESALSELTDAKHVVSCANGTDALQIALMAKGIGSGDAVFVPSFTYTATAEVILLLGATPVFVDVQKDSFNIDPNDLEAKIVVAKAKSTLRPAAVIAVDLFGLPATYSELRSICDAHGLFLLADAAQSCGASYNGRQVGTLAHVTTTSFFPAKPLGCYGDGGAIMTDDEGLASVMRSICLHGKGEAKYDVVRIGMNSRLDTIQAAILLAKLDVFPKEIERRNEIARRYTERLGGHVATPMDPGNDLSAWAQYTLRLDRRDAVQAALKEQGIPSAVYYPRPMHLQPAYIDHSEGAGSLPVSEAHADQVLSLPMHPYMSDDDIDHVARAVSQAVNQSL